MTEQHVRIVNNVKYVFDIVEVARYRLHVTNLYATHLSGVVAEFSTRDEAEKYALEQYGDPEEFACFIYEVARHQRILSQILYAVIPA